MLSWLRDGFMLSKTVPFIWGLVLSHTFVKQAVVDVLADYLEREEYLVWQVIVLSNSLDGIAAVLQVGVLYVSTYIGRFWVIFSCTVANTLGLALLWRLGSRFIFPILLTVLSTIMIERTLRDFFDYQLSEETKKKYTENNPEKRSDENGSETTNLWRYAATFSGSVIAFLCSGIINKWSWTTTFVVSFSIMGAACLLFTSGFWFYDDEEKRKGKPLNTIYVVFKEAIKKHGLSYPSSEEDYSSNINNGYSNNLLYWRENNEVHLLPREPSFLKFLDKAAIIRRNSNNARSEETNEPACTAEDVSDVKSLYPIIPLGFTFFAYSLVVASGNTYFVLQASILDSDVGDFEVPIMVFFLLSSCVAFGVRTIHSRFELVKPIWSIAFGMFFSVLCCIVAFLVERRREHVISSGKVYFYDDGTIETIQLSIMVLTPQFLLLGLMQGFAEDGFETYVYDWVPESMIPLVYPCIKILLAIGTFFNIILTFICRSWIKDYIDAEDSRLDWYFIVLASLSLLFFGIYVWYAKFRLPKLFRTRETNEGTVRRTSEVEVQQQHDQNQRRDSQEDMEA